jgi:hypothetical protein
MNDSSEMLDYTEYKQNINKTIEIIFAKYENNPYMLTKTNNYICNQLPQILDTMNQNYEERKSRMMELTNEQNGFITSFLNTNKYFYVSSTENFFYYDGIHYHLYKEDDILHHVLTSISRDRQLLSWKQKTKIYVMKRIKEKNLLVKSVPESITIQSVLDSLYPSFFSTKTEAKYFLTILGDNILKKNTDCIHFINSKSKHFILQLNNACQMFFGTNLSQTFKYKYHEHHYENCRLVKINESIKMDHIWMPILNTALDLLCVACHYSNRYSNSDNYVLQSSNDYPLIQYVFYLKNNQPENLVDVFIGEYLQKNDLFTSRMTTESEIDLAMQVTWKNMQYLWKQYLDSKNLPTIMFQQTLKQFLIQKLDTHYNHHLDSFVGIYSKYFPDIQKFMLFWEENITYDETETEMEFEIEEICNLFKQWCQIKNQVLPNMNDKRVLDIITYFFPLFDIENDKFIYKIQCSLWDKQMDIQIALDNMKEEFKKQYCEESLNISLIVSLHDAYIFYCKYYSNQNYPNIVSKIYFEKYVNDLLSEYIVDQNFISSQWLS